MKKLFSIILISSVIMGIVGCTDEETDEPPEEEIPTGNISVARQSWTPASIPPPYTIADTLIRGDLTWYNPAGGQVRTDEIFLDKKGTEEGEELRLVFNLDFVPKNNNPQSFAGITNLISLYGFDFTNTEDLEIWINDSGNRQGVLYFDVGYVSEDYRVTGVGKVRNPITDQMKVKSSYGALNTEDLNLNGKFDNGEDIGLDGFMDGDLYDDGGYNASVNPNYKHGTDNWYYDPGLSDDDPEKYKYINGTEDNDALDTEDLNRNGFLDTRESFHRYKIDLSDDYYVAQDNSEVEEDNHWRLYRIPIYEFFSQENDPDWRNIRYLRMWLTGFEEATSLQIGLITVTGDVMEKSFPPPEEHEVVLKDYDFVRRKYYYVDQPDGLTENGRLPQIDTTFVLWIDDNNSANDVEQGAIPGTAYSGFVTYDPIQPDTTLEYWDGNFVRLTYDVDYTIVNASPLREIKLNRQLGDDEVLAVAYVREDGVPVGDSDPDSLRLRLLKPETPDPDQPETWNCEAKNYYDFGFENVNASFMTFRIYKIETGTEEDYENYFQDYETFMQILHVDRYDVNSEFLVYGILKFPLYMGDDDEYLVYEPFNFWKLDVRNPIIYNKPEDELSPENARYGIYVKYSTWSR